MKLTSPVAFLSGLSRGIRVLLFVLVLLPVYFYYLSGITTNPPGFYIDEAAVSYNAYTIYERGEGEFGHSMPLYFPVFPLTPPLNYLGYIEPTQIYALAALHFFFSPSVLLSRGLSATAMFLTALLLGFLAYRISRQSVTGFIVGFTVLLTPWFFEMGRLAFGASLYPLTVSMLLIAIHSGERKGRWSLLNCLAIALALALTTYTYAIGRMLGPVFAFGLVLFAVDLQRVKGILLTWGFYAILMIPFVVVYFQDPYILTGRFEISVGYISAEKSYWQIFKEFLTHYATNISPHRLLVIGDQNLRHHITDTAPIYAATLFTAIMAFVVVLIRHRRVAFWRYVVYGLIFAVVPASLTKDDFHMLRLGAFPVFLVVLTIPAIMWLVERPTVDGKRRSIAFYLKPAALAIIMLATLVQTLMFASEYNRIGPTRTGYFDTNFPNAFAAALERPERPIYLVDQFYYLAYWQAITTGADLSNFVRIPPGEKPPLNALVLSGEERCDKCEQYFKEIPFIVYQTLEAPPVKVTPPDTRPVPPNLNEQLSVPRGVATDNKGNYFVADTGNSRIVKFDAKGTFVTSFGSPGDAESQLREPQGIAVNAAGEIFVSDALNHKLVKFQSDGTFVREWHGPDSGFYGPRDIEFGPDGKLYIVDQGRTRIVRLDISNDAFTTWGSAGAAEGQFNDPTGIAISDDSIFVTDTGNGRVQVFDLNGNFLRMWTVEQWESDVKHSTDVMYDQASKIVYVVSAKSKQLLTYDVMGNPVADPIISTILANPASIAILHTDKGRRLLVLDSSPGSVSQFELPASVKN